MTFHNLETLERWQSLPVEKQILNIASELARSLRHYRLGERQYLCDSLDRSFELVDATIADSKWKGLLRELLRVREMLGEFYTNRSLSSEEFERVIRAFLSFHPKTYTISFS